ncbi:nucleotide disphospho-sugar-binding domain-containing protein [Streptomyces olivaceus]|uniref:nucleotide disphospho-sugar-binding domain-containing protein n=1 Tax=Streptomyces olivaceus TaxID=47716 RepID=UPI0022EE853D|nr:nucleotide disphospho-sugar-binding domain-containing protein [Streptomyces olivaceus]GHI97926.1 glycosyl transferase [Streptomyces olivaceus]
MRILFTPVAATTTPLFHMVPLAWAFRAAGHDVRVAAQPELSRAIVEVGLPAVEVGHGYEIMDGVLRSRGGQRVIEAPADQWTDSGLAGTAEEPPADYDDKHADLRDAAMAPLVEAAGRMAPGLLRFTEYWRPDLLVTDSMVFAAPLVSALRGVPLVRQTWGPDVMRMVSQPLQGRAADGDVRAEWPTGLPGLYDHYGVEVRNDYPVRTVDPWPTSLQFPDLSGRLPMRFVPYNGAAVAPDWVLDRPGRPRVCVTWGTSTSALAGDEAFVLPRVVEGLAGLDVEVVLAVGPDDRRKLGTLPGGVRVAENVPLHLFMETCDAIVHQGGTSTLLTAARHGLPQVMMPQTADNPFNAANFAGSGAGVTLDAAGADAGGIGAAVTRVLTEPAWRVAAEKLREEMAEMPPPSAVVRSLEELA